MIIRLFFPNPAAGYSKFQLLKTDISEPEPTVYFTNGKGETDLTVQEVIAMTNLYIQLEEEKFKKKNGG